MYWHAIFLTLILFTVVYAVSKYVIYQLLIDQFNFKCNEIIPSFRGALPQQGRYTSGAYRIYSAFD